MWTGVCNILSLTTSCFMRLSTIKSKYWELAAQSASLYTFKLTLIKQVTFVFHKKPDTVIYQHSILWRWQPLMELADRRRISAGHVVFITVYYTRSARKLRVNQLATIHNLALFLVKKIEFFSRNVIYKRFCKFTFSTFYSYF